MEGGAARALAGRSRPHPPRPAPATRTWPPFLASLVVSVLVVAPFHSPLLSPLLVLLLFSLLLFILVSSLFLVPFLFHGRGLFPRGWPLQL